MKMVDVRSSETENVGDSPVTRLPGTLRSIQFRINKK